ncbi:MAG: LacI family DNA-binding transcriptional regulator [Anaerolineae bacterium]|nr:LacI family DNA-binding transcriptional regulator [Anaerolineae bacterium]
MPVTLKDIAARLNLSITTVSRALGGYPDVAAETRQRVLQAAREMGYHPNVIAQSLQRRRSNTLGFVIPATERYLSDPFFLELLSGIGDGAAQRGFDLLVSTCAPLSSEERTVYERMIRGKRVDGMVVARTRKEDERISYLVQEGFPMAAFGRTALALDFPFIDVDGEEGVGQAMAHLLGSGHRRIGFISPPVYLMFTEHRLAGYRRALERSGLGFDASLVVEGNLSQASGYEMMGRLLDLGDPPSAVVCGNDLMALGAIHAIQERGLAVGRDIAVVGFDDIPLAEHCHPPLTTVRQPIYEIGKMASEMVIQIIEGRELQERQVILQPQLVIRESTVTTERG